MHLLAITVGNAQVGSTRIRLLNYLPYLHESGWTITVHEPVARSYAQRLLEVFRLGWLARHSDVVIIQKRLFQPWVTQYIRRNARRLIFEVDDPVFLDEVTGIVNRKTEARLGEHLRVADAVIVDNVSLADHCRQFNPSVHVIVSCVDVERYKPASFAQTSPFTIGWVGQPSTLPYLEEIERPLQALYERYGDRLAFKVVSATPYTSTHFPVTNKLWRLAEEPDDIRTFSVGIVPLREYFWTTYKMAYRPYLYMACGIPIVLSSIGPSLNVLEDGKEGFYARTEDYWYNALAILIENPDMCVKMGSYGREKVVQGFSYQSNYPKLLEVLAPTAGMQTTKLEGL
jgi:glycosyltransferase involved in cell wall biosynthesis